jgi:O-antigen/teichoic acid export membrane protein
MITEGHERSVKAKKNIIASFVVKSISIVISFVLVSIALGYLDETRYGIWITLSSFITWFEFFEVGLGKGLRNRLSEALALNNRKLARAYISTTYGLLLLIITTISVVFFLVNPFINWARVLNTPAIMENELAILSTIVFGGFFIRFFLQLLTNVLFADQRPAMAGSFSAISNTIALAAIYILTKTTEGSLLNLGLVLTVSPILVFSAASVYFYSTDYKEIRPARKYIDFKLIRSLGSLGIKFFGLAISSIILYETSNILIAQFFGPAEVTPYNIAYKYFSLLSIAFTIIVTPFWSAFTEAWTKNDRQWIVNAVKRLKQIWVVFLICGIFMLAVSKWFFVLWVGNSVKIPFVLSALMLVSFMVFNYGGIFSQFANGIGKINLQVYSSLIATLIYIPIAFFLVKVLHMGVESLVITTILTNWYGPLLGPVQFRKIMNNTATGVWNK